MRITFVSNGFKMYPYVPMAEAGSVGVRRINGGHHDHGNVGVCFVDVGQQRESALPGHCHIAQHQRKRPVGEELPSLGRIGCGGARIPRALEEPGQGAPNWFLVLDDKYAGIRPGTWERDGRVHCDTRSTSTGMRSPTVEGDSLSDSGNSTVMVVPTPAIVEMDARPPDRLAMP